MPSGPTLQERPAQSGNQTHTALLPNAFQDWATDLAPLPWSSRETILTSHAFPPHELSADDITCFVEEEEPALGMESGPTSGPGLTTSKLGVIVEKPLHLTSLSCEGDVEAGDRDQIPSVACGSLQDVRGGSVERRTSNPSRDGSCFSSSHRKKKRLVSITFISKFYCGLFTSSK